MLDCVYTRLDLTGTITKLVRIGLAFTQDLEDPLWIGCTKWVYFKSAQVWTFAVTGWLCIVPNWIRSNQDRTTLILCKRSPIYCYPPGGGGANQIKGNKKSVRYSEDSLCPVFDIAEFDCFLKPHCWFLEVL